MPCGRKHWLPWTPWDAHTSFSFHEQKCSSESTVSCPLPFYLLAHSLSFLKKKRVFIKLITDALSAEMKGKLETLTVGEWQAMKTHKIGSPRRNYSSLLLNYIVTESATLSRPQFARLQDGENRICSALPYRSFEIRGDDMSENVHPKLMIIE